MKAVSKVVTSSKVPLRTGNTAELPAKAIPGFEAPAIGVGNLISLLDAIEQTISGATLHGPDNTAHAMPQQKNMLTNPQETVRPCLLIVEDDTLSFSLIEDTFASDYEVLWASDGETALNIAAKRIPDLILLDVMMPAMDGYEVCTRLKVDDETSAIPIIFITGLGDEGAETRGLEMGAVDYITKPINPAAVRARVSNQIKLKWALDRLSQVAALERSLREDALVELEISTRGYPVN